MFQKYLNWKIGEINGATLSLKIGNQDQDPKFHSIKSQAEEDFISKFNKVKFSNIFNRIIFKIPKNIKFATEKIIIDSFYNCNFINSINKFEVVNSQNIFSNNK
jgi:hypothetical protein